MHSQQCVAGKKSTGTACVPCVAGEYAAAGSTACTQCLAGFFSPQPDTPCAVFGSEIFTRCYFPVSTEMQSWELFCNCWKINLQPMLGRQIHCGCWQHRTM